jgi:uncharacterized integral membrane protein
MTERATERRPRSRARQYLAFVVLLAAIAYLILLIVKNRRQVKVHYVFGSTHARLIWLIVLSAFTGWLLGLATSYLLRRRTRRVR